MSSAANSTTMTVPSLSANELANLCGVLHSNLIFLEEQLHVAIKIQQEHITIHGTSSANVGKAKEIIALLYSLTKEPITTHMLSQLLKQHDQQAMTHHIKLSRKSISARNNKQALFLDDIDTHDITFAVGPAGTGKTYLAVAKAIEYFEKGEIQRLIFVRPAVEAGEKLGFLPGDLVEKVLPYLRPIYDALYEMIGFKETQKLIQTDVIEVLPLAFMRGRTLNESFIILDEAQNTTTMQMKMFLTRMGFGSKAVITGDMTQIDLPKGTDSGLANAVRLFGAIPEISIHQFTSQEVVRHPLISKIIDCYELETKGHK